LPLMRAAFSFDALSHSRPPAHVQFYTLDILMRRRRTGELAPWTEKKKR
jgi:hypothetical protein